MRRAAIGGARLLRVRILTSLVLIGLLAVVALVFDTLLLNAVIVLVCALALAELLKATGLFRHRWLTVLVMAQALVIPFARTTFVGPVILPLLFLIVFGYFLLLVTNYGKVSLASCATAFLLGLIIPLFFSSAVYIRDLHGVTQGGFYILVALGAAWLSDTSAYFVGTLFGKRKLAPKVSPQKTIEGTLGGIVISTGLLLLLGMIYQARLGASVNFFALAALSPVFSVIAMLGDLTASAIKREYGVKDFGTIMPGHGGVLDRFDSVLFTLPAVYVATRYFELITL